jgi:hypothetical protein
MKLTSFGGALLLSAGLVAVAGSARAANYVGIDGVNVQFFYDADYWGANSAKVKGNSISFGVPNDYAASAKVDASSQDGQSWADFAHNNELGLIVVVKDGYQLQGSVGVKLSGDFQLAANGGQFAAVMNGYLSKGVYSNDAFVPFFTYSPYALSVGDLSNGTVNSGTLSASVISADEFPTASNPTMSAMGVGVYLGGYAFQTGLGMTAIAIPDVTYDFTVKAVTAVPEPETYAMMLVGLSLVGGVARRRGATV